MDTAPQDAARDYADGCYRKGRLGCFLQLQMRIMGDNFRRVAQSSYGEAAHSTQSKRLLSAGVDTDRFFHGALFQYASKDDRVRDELWPWRLSRAMNEAGLHEAMGKDLRKVASDASVDDYNRFRATQTLVFMHLRNQGDTQDRKAIAKKLKNLDLSEMSQIWLKRFSRVD